MSYFSVNPKNLVGPITITGNLTVTGDLSVQGSTTLVATTTSGLVQINDNVNLQFEGVATDVDGLIVSCDSAGDALLNSTAGKITLTTFDNNIDTDSLFSWTAGQTITTTSYQVGRDGDGTNQLHFNVPTGASFEFSINDTAELILNATNLKPGADDGVALGESGTGFADLFLASAGVINFAAGDVTVTHGTNTLTFAGASSGYSFDAAVSVAVAGNNLSVKNTTDNASVQLAILEGDRATVADNDEGYLTFRLSDDAGTQTEVARLTWVATDVNVASSVDAKLDFSVMTAGALAKELSLTGTDLSPITSDGLALGTTALMWADLFLASAGVINFNNGDVTLTHGTSALTLASAIATTGSPVLLTLTAPAHTTLSTAEVTDVNINLNRTVEITGTGGTLALQRAMRVQAPTYAFTQAHTITTAASFQISGAPTAGTNATIVNASALSIASFTSAATSPFAISIIQPGIANSKGDMTTLASIGIPAAGNVSLGNQTATLTNLFNFMVDAITYESTTLTRTVTTACGLYIGAVASCGSNVTITNANAICAGGATTQVTATGLVYDILKVPAHTLTLTGTTQMTSTPSIVGLNIKTITATDSSSVTVNSAASLYIENAPQQAGSVTITNAYALWVDAGKSRFEGLLEQVTTVSDGTTQFDITYTSSGAGSAVRNGMVVTLAAGSTTSGLTGTFAALNNVAGTSTVYQSDAPAGQYGFRPNGNRGLSGYATGSTAGTNIGGLYLANRGTINFGIWSGSTSRKNSASNVGIYAVGFNDGTSPVQIGGFFHLYEGGSTAPTLGTSAALIADNSTTTSDIFDARDNAVSILKILDGGFISIAPTDATSGTSTDLLFTGADHTGLTASTEVSSLAWTAGTRIWAAGNIVTQREWGITAPTYTIAGGLSTITNSSAFQVTGAPIAGTSTTITNNSAISIGSYGTTATNEQALSVIQPGIAASVGNVTTLTAIGIANAGNVTLGNQTANLTNLLSVNVPGLTYVSTTLTRTVTGTVASVYIGGAPTASTNVTFNSPAYALVVDAGASRFDGRVLETQGADVASGNDLTLGADGNVFEITGTTQINAITTTAWQNGSMVTLLFTSTPTVKYNTAGGAGTAVILLAGAADFAATAGDTLTLVLSEIGGTQAWREVARTAI